MILYMNSNAPDYEPDKWNGTVKDENYLSLLSEHSRLIQGVVAKEFAGQDAAADIKSLPLERTKSAIHRIVKDMEEGKSNEELAQRYGVNPEEIQAFKPKALDIYQKEGYDAYANCYAYAMNDKDRFNRGGASPGDRAALNTGEILEVSSPDYRSFKQSIIKGIEADGAIFAGKSAESISGYYKVAVFTKQGDPNESKDEPEFDMHFIRQDKDGWSHKAGSFPVTDKDYKGNKITDPEKADIGYDFIGYAMVPEGGLDVGGSALEPKSKPKSVEISREAVQARAYQRADLPAFAND